MNLISEIETFLSDHAGLDGPETREIVRRVSAGEAVALPEAVTLAGVDVRNALVAALAAAQAVTEPAAALPAPAASNAASGMTSEARRVVLAAIAPEPAFAGTVAFLASSDMPLEEAAATLRVVKEQAASVAKVAGLPAGHRTIEQRSAEMPEFGPQAFAPGGVHGQTKREVIAASWSKAMKAAQDSAPLQTEGR